MAHAHVLFIGLLLLAAAWCQDDYLRQAMEKARSRAFRDSPSEFRPFTTRPHLSEPMQNFFYNALDYGAKGDQVTDNTDAVNSALGVIRGNGGGILLFPPGKYRFNGNINIPDGVNVPLLRPQRHPVWSVWPPPAQLR